MTIDAPDELPIKTKKVVKKRQKTTKFRKAPQAPKRFKSAFIFFSVEKHPEIRKQLAAGTNSDVPNVAKLVSEAWRSLSPEDRSVWEKKAEDDKKRYELERTMYTGPWKIPASKRAKKDPDAPKRPMSAFLAYSKKRRSEVKGENAHLSNTEVSKLLATKWKEAPEPERQVFIEQEAGERQLYKVAIAKWRANQEEKLDAQRMQREHIATMAVANGQTVLKPEQLASIAGTYGAHPSNGYSYGPPAQEMNMPPSNMAYHDGPGYPQGHAEPGREYGWSNGMPDTQHISGQGPSSGQGYWSESRQGGHGYGSEGQMAYSNSGAGYGRNEAKRYPPTNEGSMYSNYNDAGFTGSYQQPQSSFQGGSNTFSGGNQVQSQAAQANVQGWYPNGSERHPPIEQTQSAAGHGPPMEQPHHNSVKMEQPHYNNVKMEQSHYNNVKMEQPNYNNVVSSYPPQHEQTNNTRQDRYPPQASQGSQYNNDQLDGQYYGNNHYEY